VVSGVRSSSSALTDYRATAGDAAAKGRLGLSAAQAYIQSALVTPTSSSGTASSSQTVATPADAAQTSADGSAQSNGGASQQSQSQDTSSALPAFQLAASYSQMLAAQEAGSQTAAQSNPQVNTSTSRANQATGAYAATLALTEEPAAMDMQMPGWSDGRGSGQRVNFSA